MTPTDAEQLDASTLNRAAPAGSLRYFALLYTPPERRDALTALFVIDTELRESAASASHDVAHTRLQWWRSEIDRLINANPQHPATRVLNKYAPTNRAAFNTLHELVAAADMDLARMTYVNAQELRAYCSRSGGALLEAIAGQLAPATVLEEPLRVAINRIGIGIRQTEIMRDLRQDAHDGRVYVPLDEMERLNLTREMLDQAATPAPAREVLRWLQQQALDNLAQPPTTQAWHAALRPIWVLAALHHRLLRRLSQRQFDVGSKRIDLGPVEKPWIAWRAAVRRK